MSIKIKYNITPKCQIEADVDDVKDMIKTISAFSVVLCEKQCGACNSQNIAMSHKIAKGFEFYELVCQDCNCRLKFGQHKEGNTLFAKRDDGDRGWVKFQREDYDQTTAHEPKQTAPSKPTSDSTIPF